MDTTNCQPIVEPVTATSEMWSTTLKHYLAMMGMAALGHDCLLTTGGELCFDPNSASVGIRLMFLGGQNPPCLATPMGEFRMGVDI